MFRRLQFQRTDDRLDYRGRSRRVKPLVWSNLHPCCLTDSGHLSEFVHVIDWLSSQSLNHLRRDWCEDDSRHRFRAIISKILLNRASQSARRCESRGHSVCVPASDVCATDRTVDQFMERQFPTVARTGGGSAKPAVGEEVPDVGSEEGLCCCIGDDDRSSDINQGCQ